MRLICIVFHHEVVHYVNQILTFSIFHDIFTKQKDLHLVLFIKKDCITATNEFFYIKLHEWLHQDITKSFLNWIADCIVRQGDMQNLFFMDPSIVMDMANFAVCFSAIICDLLMFCYLVDIR